MLRKGLLWASTNQSLKKWAMSSAGVQRATRKFMPGETMDDALSAAKKLYGGVNSIYTRLGENVSTAEEAQGVRDHYALLVGRIKALSLDGQISVKPTQLGYDLDGGEMCLEHCRYLLKQCEESGSFLWLDMESSPYVDGTLRIFTKLRQESPRCGIALQAYLHRTPSDIEALVPLGCAIRLVKGAYKESSEVALQTKTEVDAAYLKLGSRLLDKGNSRPGALVHFATHDLGLQEQLLQIAQKHGVPKERFEMAMLYGIQTQQQEELVRMRVNVRCLIAYGESWYPWYLRRLAEKPAANLAFLVRRGILGM